MKRILSALVAGAAALVLATPGFAAAPDAMATAGSAMHSTTMKAGSAMHSTSMKAGSSMKSMGASMKMCPKGQTAVKGYTKADGTKVASYCRKSKAM